MKFLSSLYALNPIIHRTLTWRLVKIGVDDGQSLASKKDGDKPHPYKRKFAQLLEKGVEENAPDINALNCIRATSFCV